MLRIFFARANSYDIPSDINNTSPQEERRNINMCKVHFVKIMFKSSYLLSEPVVHLGAVEVETVW